MGLRQRSLFYRIAVPEKANMPRPMPRRDLIAFCRRMATSLDAGVDLRKTWQRETDRARGSQRRAIADISQRIAGGTTMADSMSAAGDTFPPLVRDLVHIGELSGNSEKIFAGLADYYRHLDDLRRSYIKGITWPVLQLVMALVVVGLFILITGLIAENNADSPDMLGLGLSGVGGFLAYISTLAVMGLVLAFFVRGWSRGKLGAPILMKVLMRVPYLGEAIKNFALARLSWTLALVSQTDMDVRKALGLAIRGTNNAYYTPHEEKIRNVISQGRPIHEALRESGVFPYEFVDAIEAGETAGKLNDSLAFLSREYKARAELMSETLTKVASMATWAIVAMIIIFFIFRIFSVYLNAINGLM